MSHAKTYTEMGYTGTCVLIRPESFAILGRLIAYWMIDLLITTQATSATNRPQKKARATNLMAVLPKGISLPHSTALSKTPAREVTTTARTQDIHPVTGERYREAEVMFF